MAKRKTTMRKTSRKASPKRSSARSKSRNAGRRKIIHVVKRKGHNEHFDERKVYASVYAAALNCNYPDYKSEEIARTVTEKIKKWIKHKEVVDYTEIRAEIQDAIKDQDVLLMYRHHEDLC